MREQYSTQLAIAAGVLILIASAVFSLVQSPEMLEFNDVAAVKSSPPVPHPAEGYSKCNTCHALKSENPYSLKHAGWSNESCLRCHEIDKNAVAISALPGLISLSWNQPNSGGVSHTYGMSHIFPGGKRLAEWFKILRRKEREIAPEKSAYS